MIPQTKLANQDLARQREIRRRTEGMKMAEMDNLWVSVLGNEEVTRVETTGNTRIKNVLSEAKTAIK